MLFRSGPGITYVKAALDSMYGRIYSAWRIDNEDMHVEIEIPHNTTATVILPCIKEKQIYAGERTIDRFDGISAFSRDNEEVKFDLGSGKYQFTIR